MGVVYMYDLTIIGAGIKGASIARELSKYDLKVLVLEKANDVASGLIKGNPGIVGDGVDYPKDSYIRKLAELGNELLDELCEDLSVPIKRIKTRKYWGKDEKSRFTLDESSAVIGPWELVIALMENAVKNGVELRLNKRIESIIENNNYYTIVLKDEKIESKYIIDSIGLNFGKNDEKIIYDNAVYFVLDKFHEQSLKEIISFNVDDRFLEMVPTVFGNILIGGIINEDYTYEDLKEKVYQLVESYRLGEIIANYDGSFPKIEKYEEEIIHMHNRFIRLGGLGKNGLSVAPALAIDIVKKLKNSGLRLKRKEKFISTRKQLIFMNLASDEKLKLIERDNNYGKIVCRCEKITEGEIIEAINNLVGARTIDGVKRRCRPGMGVCQGGFCGPKVQEILSRELDIPIENIEKDKPGSYILTD